MGIFADLVYIRSIIELERRGWIIGNGWEVSNNNKFHFILKIKNLASVDLCHEKEI